MSKLKLKYALIDRDSKTYLAILPLNSTFADLQALVEKRTGKHYSHIFLHKTEIDSDDKVGDWIENDDDLIVLSDQESTPSPEFMMNFKKKVRVRPEATLSTPKPDCIPPTVLDN